MKETEGQTRQGPGWEDPLPYSMASRLPNEGLFSGHRAGGRQDENAALLSEAPEVLLE